MRKTATKNAFAPLWQVAAYNYSPQSAAHEFTQTYWDKPRKMIWKGNDTFQVEDGVRTYCVVFVPGADDCPALYQVGAIN